MRNHTQRERSVFVRGFPPLFGPLRIDRDAERFKGGRAKGVSADERKQILEAASVGAVLQDSVVLNAMSKAELLAYIASLPAAKLAELEAIVAGMTAETSASGPSLSRKEIDALRLSLFERYGYFDSTATIRELRDNGPRQLRYVIDASVATKWLLPETDSSSALAVLDAAQASRIALLAPALIGLEFGHVLGKELRRGRCDAATAERLWSAFRGLPITLVSARLLQDRAFLFSVTRRITMYDALYVAVAEAEGVPLISADAGLIAAVNGSDNRIIHMDEVSAQPPPAPQGRAAAEGLCRLPRRDQYLNLSPRRSRPSSAELPFGEAQASPRTGASAKLGLGPQGVHVDRDRAISVGLLEGDAHEAVGTLLHPLLRNRRAEDIAQ